MAKPSDHPGFRQLLDEWNEKLKESGLLDIERSGIIRDLKRPGTIIRYDRLKMVCADATVEYFRRLGWCLHETIFDNELEKEILTLYSQGITQADIYRRLGLTGHRCKVYEPLYRWLKEWGMKPYRAPRGRNK